MRRTVQHHFSIGMILASLTLVSWLWFGSGIVQPDNFLTIQPALAVAGQCANRTAIATACACGIQQVSSGYCCYVTAASPVAQSTQCGYTEVSPHWNHILTFKEDYRYPPAGSEQTEADWNAKHWDGGMTNPQNKIGVNPNLKAFLYRIDQTYFVDGYDPYDGQYVQLQNFAAARGYDLEDAFLHFSENTVVNGFPTGTYPGGTVSFTCSGQKTAACRMRVYDWNTVRWEINPKSALTREFYASEWQRVTGSTYQGIFLDEHPYFIHGYSNIVSGGKIVEYPGLKWTDASFGTQYNTDLIAFLQAQKTGLGSKLLLPNSAAYSPDAAAVSQGLATDGMYYEAVDNPNLDRYHTNLAWTSADQLMSAGKMVVWTTVQKGNGNPPDYIPAGYTAGNSATAAYRSRIYELGFYYLAKDAANQLAYFNILGAWGLPYSQSWTAAQEVDIGTPTASRTTYKTGTDGNGQSYTVYARPFTHGYVLLRPKEGWSYNTFDDTSSVTVALPKLLQPVAADGTIGTAVGQVTLRNSEAAIFYDPATPPADQTAPAAVTDLTAR